MNECTIMLDYCIQNFTVMSWLCHCNFFCWPKSLLHQVR